MTDLAPMQPRPWVLFIGAGSQGHAYAGPIKRLGLATVVGICEPILFKRQDFTSRYIPNSDTFQHLQFQTWQDFIVYEQSRREKVISGAIKLTDIEFHGVDAVFICVLDEFHVKAIRDVAPLGLHIMCEKPLATSLEDCISIRQIMRSAWKDLGHQTIFGIGHVLRYSPQNMLLRKLVRGDRIIGDVVSLEHTEPVGWWHMAHSFVRGNWRRHDTTAPILLTKCCHDIDFLMWMLCSPYSKNLTAKPHEPSFITSSGNLIHFRKSRKPKEAGSATNCISCPIEKSCIYSSRNIYVNIHLKNNDLDWPLKTVVPEIEDIYSSKGKEAAEARLIEVLSQDYNQNQTDDEIKQRPWHGRCVWESDNNVCDDQTVTITWEENLASDGKEIPDQGPKTAIFHMVAPTEKICERRGRIYGTQGEITYDENLVSVYDFRTGKTTVHHANDAQGGGHGGGDDSLAQHFCKAVEAVVNGSSGVAEAQRQWLGCDLEEVVRSHVAVFAAEKARTSRTVVNWSEFWEKEVEKLTGA